jgi:DNA processing protein
VPDLRITKSELKLLLPKEDSAEVEKVFSYLAWSAVCEPGDGFAGLLVSALGATQALSIEIDDESSKRVREKLKDAGISSEVIDSFGIFEKAHYLARQRWKPRFSLNTVRASIHFLDKLKGFTLTPQSQIWPSGFQDLGFHSPMALWVRGNYESIEKLSNSVAVVGCRGSTSYGEFAASSVVTALVEKNISIISGGAYGIDAAAHRTTLALRGNTVAVMAGGVARLYPHGHAELLKRIIETGAVFSELPPGSAPSKWRFLQRNRLIAAASQSSVVVEANWRSGALNTASHANAIGRDVFAIPGPISSPKSAGTNKLIADSRAQLILDGKDLLDRLGIESQEITRQQLTGLGAIERRTLDAIGFGSFEIAEICLEAGLTRDEARFGLGNLELEGLIVRRGNAWTKSQTTV